MYGSFASYSSLAVNSYALNFTLIDNRPARYGGTWSGFVSSVSLFLSNADIDVYSFEPTIVAGLGYSGNSAQLMSVPPFAVAFVCTYFKKTVSLMFIHLAKKSVNNIGHHIGSLPVPWIHCDILFRSAADRLLHVLRYVAAIRQKRTSD